MAGRRKLRAEHGWWLGVILWAVALVAWHPEEPPSYLEVPSASPRPPGYGIFHDLVATETAGARRLLGRPGTLSDDVGVLLVLSPKRAVPRTHREEMLEWVSDGGTLVVGHPLREEGGGEVGQLSEESTWLADWQRFESSQALVLRYVPYEVPEPREVPDFGHVLPGELNVAEYGSYTLLVGEGGVAAATVEPFGEGRVIQLAAASLLDNRSLGWKQTHLFAAALLDEAGRDTVWAFDEAYEGIEPEPRFMALVGSSRWRGVFLQLLLLALFVYWRASARLGRPAAAPPAEATREVATQARDTGDFYFRAGQSRWALSRALDHFRLVVRERGAASESRDRAMALIAEAEQELGLPGGDGDRHARLIRRMAVCQRELAESSKGKHR